MRKNAARGNAGASAERELYTTFLASSFRTLRFGITEAHGKGMAVQFNYLVEKGGFVAVPDGTYSVNFSRIKEAVRDLTHELLTIEAEGNYAGAKALFDKWAVVPPAMQRAFDALKSLPTDIDPVNER